MSVDRNICPQIVNCEVILEAGGEFDRRKLLVSSVGLLIGALTYDDGAIAEASQFADSKI